MLCGRFHCFSFLVHGALCEVQETLCVDRCSGLIRQWERSIVSRIVPRHPRPQTLSEVAPVGQKCERTCFRGTHLFSQGWCDKVWVPVRHPQFAVQSGRMCDPERPSVDSPRRRSTKSRQSIQSRQEWRPWTALINCASSIAFRRYPSLRARARMQQAHAWKWQ